MDARSDQPGDVRDVGHEQCAAFIGDGSELVKVDSAGIG